MFNPFDMLVVLDAAFEFNFTNFTSNWVELAFSPYVAIFGNFFWGAFFGFIGAGVYVNTQNNIHAFIYLVLVGFVFGVILPYGLAAIFGLLVVFMATVVTYNAYVSHKTGG